MKPAGIRPHGPDRSFNVASRPGDGVASTGAGGGDAEPGAIRTALAGGEESARAHIGATKLSRANATRSA